MVLVDYGVLSEQWTSLTSFIMCLFFTFVIYV